MFKKLRNRFVLLNFITTSLILLVAFFSIYLFASNSAEHRKPIPPEVSLETTVLDVSSSPNGEVFDVRHFVEERVVADRKLALDNLIVVLIIIGCSVELSVIIFSLYFASEAIKPVKEAYETQKIFIANASHEIKTPVAAIKANLEASELTQENHWIKNIELETDKIERLNLDLLKLAKTDSIKEATILEDIKLKSFVKRTVESFEPRLKSKGLKLSTTYSLDLKKSTKLNSADFREILEILIDNAIKYSASKISITVSSKSITIKNDGTIIPQDKITHIFDRFYQVDKSSSGSGLGLAIADSLAKRNNWTLKANSDETSTSFILNF